MWQQYEKFKLELNTVTLEHILDCTVLAVQYLLQKVQHKLKLVLFFLPGVGVMVVVYHRSS